MTVRNSLYERKFPSKRILVSDFRAVQLLRNITQG
jgi:hypothetical protein